jgi:AAHS family benzoate transporter-like MFS transporter
MFCEGFDLVVFGNIIPLLLEDTTMNLTRGIAGNIGSLIFLGMLIGGIACGRIRQSLSARVVVIGGLFIFSTLVLATALSPNGLVLGILRFVTGLGLGVVMPTAMSVARASVNKEHAGFAITFVMTGISVGALMASLIVTIVSGVSSSDSSQWRIFFAPPAALGLICGGLFLLGSRLNKELFAEDSPKSQNGVVAKESNSHEWTAVFSKRHVFVLLLFAIGGLGNQFCYYGVTTWLPQLMREFSLPMNSSFLLMVVYNLGAICGSTLMAFIGDRLGTRVSAIACGSIAAVCLLIIAGGFSGGILVYVLIILVGAGSITALNLLSSTASNAFPLYLVPAALGIITGVGRGGSILAPSIGGWILDSGFGPGAVMTCFAAFSLIGVLMISLCTKKRIEQSSSTNETDISS